MSKKITCRKAANSIISMFLSESANRLGKEFLEQGITGAEVAGRLIVVDSRVIKSSVGFKSLQIQSERVVAAKDSDPSRKRAGCQKWRELNRKTPAKRG